MQLDIGMEPLEPLLRNGPVEIVAVRRLRANNSRPHNVWQGQAALRDEAAKQAVLLKAAAERHAHLQQAGAVHGQALQTAALADERESCRVGSPNDLGPYGRAGRVGNEHQPLERPSVTLSLQLNKLPRSGSLRNLEVEERAIWDLQPQSIPCLAIFLQKEGKPSRPLDDPPSSVCPLQRGDLVVRQNAIRQRELQGTSLL
mmetsp:Transcript_14866/g.42654  ORF Transcript_14866/g.42654 Transcript_14866/m.42654 type:complete len:201 (+) Transcript_14866:443-1045(+)